MKLVDINDINDVRSEINNILHSPKFSKFSEEEQNHIMLSFGVYLDSFAYWEKNIEIWCDKLDIDLYDSPMTKGSITPAERQSIRAATRNEYAMTDLRGSLWAVALGAIPGIGWGVYGLAVVAGAVSSSADKAIFK